MTNNWEESLMAIGPENNPDNDPTPIYTALYLEYRKKFWEKMGFTYTKKEQEK